MLFQAKTTYIYNQRKRFHIPIKYRIKSSQVCKLHILQLAFTFSTKLIKRQLKAKIPYFRIRFQPPSLFQQAITKNRRILKLYDYCADSTNATRFRIGWPNLSTLPPAATFNLSAEMPYFLTSRSLTTCARSKLNFWLKAGVPVAESAYPLIVYVAFGDSFILLARYDKFTSPCGDNLSEPILKNTVRGAMLVSVMYLLLQPVVVHLPTAVVIAY